MFDSPYRNGYVERLNDENRKLYEDIQRLRDKLQEVRDSATRAFRIESLVGELLSLFVKVDA